MSRRGQKPPPAFCSGMRWTGIGSGRNSRRWRSERWGWWRRPSPPSARWEWWGGRGAGVRHALVRWTAVRGTVTVVLMRSFLIFYLLLLLLLLLISRLGRQRRACCSGGGGAGRSVGPRRRRSHGQLVCLAIDRSPGARFAMPKHTRLAALPLGLGWLARASIEDSGLGAIVALPKLLCENVLALPLLYSPDISSLPLSI